MQDEFSRKLTGIWKEDEWLYFELIENKPKTKVFQVMSKCSDIRLGIVKWFPKWRYYCFFPTVEEETVYSDRCLLSISEFITELNNKQKEEKTGDDAVAVVTDGIPPTLKSVGILPTIL